MSVPPLEDCLEKLEKLLLVQVDIFGTDAAVPHQIRMLVCFLEKHFRDAPTRDEVERLEYFTSIVTGLFVAGAISQDMKVAVGQIFLSCPTIIDTAATVTTATTPTPFPPAPDNVRGAGGSGIVRDNFASATFNNQSFQHGQLSLAQMVQAVPQMVQAEVPDENPDRPSAVRGRATKRTLPWDLAGGELDLVSPMPPTQAEDIPARKKPRLEEPLSASTDEAATKTAPPDVSVDLPAAADNADTRVTGHWTPEEDANLKCAVTNTSKKKWGNEYKIDFAAAAALVSGRTASQCKNRWKNGLDPSIDQAARKTLSTDVSVGPPLPVADDDDDDTNADPLMDTQPNARATRARWTTDEDAHLTSAVANTSERKWGRKYKADWIAVAALVPGRTKKQCKDRWKNGLDPSIGRANGSTGRWVESEDSELKDAVQTHGDKDWVTAAALVPGRTKKQCWNRWHDALNPSIALTVGRTGRWSKYEDIKLKDAVQMHGDKNWGAITVLVSGRTKSQCQSRWQKLHRSPK
jgi:hypothetical protein